MASSNLRLFVRRLARYLNAEERIEQAWSEAYGRDRQFDGGEFSGPATVRAIEKASDAAAERLGFVNAETARSLAYAFGVRTNSDFFLNTGVPNLPGLDVRKIEASRRYY
jgi:hypothetical protein